MKKLTILAIFAGLLFLRQIFVFADAVDKITWCHCEPNGNCQTLELPQQALEQAGHVDAGGNPLHAGDHAGACVAPSVTPSPTVQPSPTPTDIVPSPTEEPSITPTETPKKEESKGDGGSQPSTNTTSAPRYSCPFEVGKVDALNVESGVANDNAIELYWTPIASANKVNIYYSEERGNWRYSVIGVEDNGHFQVGGLTNGQHYWFSIEGTQDACTGPRSVEVDPLP